MMGGGIHTSRGRPKVNKLKELVKVASNVPQQILR